MVEEHRYFLVIHWNGDLTLYAHWEQIEYTLIFRYNGIEINEEYRRKITYPSWYTNLPVLDESKDIPESQYFVNWYDGMTIISNGTRFVPDGTNPEIYIEALTATRMYTITYDANGGDGAPEQDIKEHGVDIALPSVDEEPTREGYRFRGWSPSTTDTSIMYKSGEIFVINKSITLYAIWQEKYEITYDAKGGTGAPASQTKYYDEDINLRPEVPTREGYRFKGWTTNENSVTATYQPGDLYTVNSKTTFFAVWQKIYTITYDANGGTGEPAAHPKYHGDNISLSKTIPTRDGYKFDGWSLDQNAEDGTYDAGATFTRDANTTLYAIWKRKYTISYNANEGTGAPGAQTKYHGESITLSSTTPTREGYIFLGWNTSAVASDGTYGEGATYTEEGDTTLYAIWQLGTYTVIYNANGGTGDNASASRNIDTSLEIEDAARFSAPSGKHFSHWNTEINGTGTSYNVGDTYTYTGKSIETLYAIWTEHTDDTCYDYTYHYCTGSSTTGGGCYTIPIAHTHTDSCKKEVDGCYHSGSGTLNYCGHTECKNENGGAGGATQTIYYSCSICHKSLGSVFESTCKFTAREPGEYSCKHTVTDCDKTIDGYKISCAGDGSIESQTLNCGGTP